MLLVMARQHWIDRRDTVTCSTGSFIERAVSADLQLNELTALVRLYPVV